MKRNVRRFLALALCLGLTLSMFGPASAAEGEIYLQPIAGGVAQVELGTEHIAVLRSDGTVAATGNNDWGQCDVSDWSRIVKIWACGNVTLGLTDSGELLCSAGKLNGWRNIADVDVELISTIGMVMVAGLKTDGTAVSIGINARGMVPMTQENMSVASWKDITQVLVYEGVYGLKSDGTVVQAAFENPYADQSVTDWAGVRELAKTAYGVFGIAAGGAVYSQSSYYGCGTWQDVVKIIPGSLNCVYGLTSDGRLLSGGETALDCSGLSGLADAAVGVSGLVGLKEDGSVVLLPEPTGWSRDRRAAWDRTEALVWDPGFAAVAAVQRDGTVVAASLEDFDEPAECDGWTKIAALRCEGDLWLGVKQDGSLVCNLPDIDLTALTAGVKNTRPQERQVDLVAAGVYHSVYVRSDGKVVGVGRSDSGRLDVEDWADIVAVSAGGHTVGLRANGTVLATGPNEQGQCDVYDWKDIVDICAGYLNTVGLDGSGRVFVVGNNDYGQLALSGRQGVVDVAAGDSTVYALTNKGKVYSVGNDTFGQCRTEDWAGIVSIAAGTSHVVGLKADGTVVAAGNNDNGQCDVSGWTDIIAVSAGTTHTIGLKSDGTVVYAGNRAFGKTDVESWTGVIAISANAYHTLAITSDGLILAAGSNTYGQCDVNG